jgi:hypothetical protein
MVENAKETLCRNVTIYGKCRFEDKGEDRSHEGWCMMTEKAQAVLSIMIPQKSMGHKIWRSQLGTAREITAVHANGHKATTASRKH